MQCKRRHTNVTGIYVTPVGAIKQCLDCGQTWETVDTTLDYEQAMSDTIKGWECPE